MIVYSEIHMERNVWRDDKSFDSGSDDEEGVEEEDQDEDYTSALHSIVCIT